MKPSGNVLIQHAELIPFFR